MQLYIISYSCSMMIICCFYKTPIMPVCWFCSSASVSAADGDGIIEQQHRICNKSILPFLNWNICGIITSGFSLSSIYVWPIHGLPRIRAQQSTSRVWVSLLCENKQKKTHTIENTAIKLCVCWILFDRPMANAAWHNVICFRDDITIMALISFIGKNNININNTCYYGKYVYGGKTKKNVIKTWNMCKKYVYKTTRWKLNEKKKHLKKRYWPPLRAMCCAVWLPVSCYAQPEQHVRFVCVCARDASQMITPLSCHDRIRYAMHNNKIIHYADIHWNGPNGREANTPTKIA